MSNSLFRFKQFSIEQSGAAMKVGTDGVLLGAWLRVAGTFRRYLDIGTGTGVVALMVAQRTHGLSYADDKVIVDAVELDSDAARQAKENVAASPWADRVCVHERSIQDFVDDICRRVSGIGVAADIDSALGATGSAVSEKREGMPPVGLNLYDHIFSNPPWFVDDLQSPVAKRNVARHAVGLPYGTLLECVAALLNDNGVFSAVLPASNSDSFVSIAAASGLTLRRRTVVFTLPDTEPKRVLLEFARDGLASYAVCEDMLTIETGLEGRFTEEYRELTKDFYLKF